MIAIVHGIIERVQEVREVKRTSVLNFTLKATVRMGDKEYPRYVRCAAWGKLGEAIQADVVEGRYAVVVGEPGCSAYTSKDGEAKASLEVNAREVSFVETGDAPAPKAKSSGGKKTVPDDDDDMPF